LGLLCPCACFPAVTTISPTPSGISTRVGLIELTWELSYNQGNKSNSVLSTAQLGWLFGLVAWFSLRCPLGSPPMRRGQSRRARVASTHPTHQAMRRSLASMPNAILGHAHQLFGWEPRILGPIFNVKCNAMWQKKPGGPRARHVILRSHVSICRWSVAHIHF
jgi:hypothetical protein